jgi:P27 family predicted phage terminase small subunit
MNFQKGGDRMGRPRQPVELVAFKGKKHLTKAEIEERKAQEVKAANDKVEPPSYLREEMKEEFMEIANELLDIGIMTNLDVDALARFLIAKTLYLEVTNKLLEQPELMITEKDIVSTQDKLFKQSRVAATDLGLTISSRCKLVVPKTKEEKPKNKFEKFAR